MPNNHAEVERIIDDLKFVKQAIAKNSNVLKFMALSRVIRAVALATGLLITVFSGALYLLIHKFGSFKAVPSAARVLMLGLIVLLTIMLGVFKVVRVMRSAHSVRGDYNMVRLVQEIYTPQTVLILIPFFVAIIGTAIFFDVHNLEGYLVPALALLFGLLFNALVNVFSLKELMVGGDWMIGTGLLTLFAGSRVHPLLALIGTFGMGFIAIFAASLAFGRIEGESIRG